MKQGRKGRNEGGNWRDEKRGRKERARKEWMREEEVEI